MTTYDRFSTTRRPVLISVLMMVALFAAPLTFSPADAATTTVAGRVVDSAGSPVDDAWISVWSRNDDDATYYYEDDLATTTNLSGRFGLDIAPGTYKFHVEGGRQHVAEYYDDASSLKAAAAVVVSEGPVVLDDVELELLPSVKGVLTTDDGAPVRQGFVVAYARMANRWEDVDATSTDSSGRYDLPLDPGTYRLGFFDENGEVVPEFWQDAASVESGRDVTVGAAGVSGIDGRLRRVPAPRPDFKNLTLPGIGSSAVVGQTLRVDDGRWTPVPSTISRQWTRNGVPIPGATGATYTVAPADWGTQLRAVVTAAGPTHGPTSVTSYGNGTVRWPSKLFVTSKPGRKKATIGIRVTSPGGPPSGKVVIKQRFTLIKVVWLKDGNATLTLKRLKKKQQYTFHYYGTSATHPSVVNRQIRTK